MKKEVLILEIPTEIAKEIGKELQEKADKRKTEELVDKKGFLRMRRCNPFGIMDLDENEKEKDESEDK